MATDRLVETEAEMLRSEWLDPHAGKVPLGEYADRWVRERDLKAPHPRGVRTASTPARQTPLGNLALNEITPQLIRTWRAALIENGVGRSTVAKTYRILHDIFATAVDDS
jgi:hypothetical protein